jgi:hypothetical protein
MTPRRLALVAAFVIGLAVGELLHIAGCRRAGVALVNVFGHREVRR